MNRVEYSSNANINNYANMINDRWRNEFFYNALKKHAAGKVVLDVGTGTGILAFYAKKKKNRTILLKIILPINLLR